MPIRKKVKPLHWLMLAGFVIISIAFTTVLYSFYVVEEIKEINVSASHTNASMLGFNLDPGQISFGSTPTGVLADRAFFVSYDKNYPVRVKIRIVGDISPYISFSKHDFILQPNSTEKINTYLTFTKKALIKRYEGKIIIQFSKNI
ncbi:MAG: hypothetical protein AABX51_04235 [Nanoarchaeota archaeon]